MSLLPEDAHADISGDAPPVSAGNQKQVAANVNRAAKSGNRPTPKPAPAPSPESPAQKKADPTSGSAPIREGTARASASPQGNTPSQPPPWNLFGPPIDWGQLIKDDAATAYHASRDTLAHIQTFMTGTGADRLPGDAVRNVEGVWSAFDDSSAINRSVQNVWEQDNAQAALARYLLSGNPLQAFAPTQQGSQQAQEVTGTGLEIAANPENALGMGVGNLASRMALIAGPQILQAIGSTNPNDQVSQLSWAALTGMLLSRGHLPPGASEEITKQLGQWPALEKSIKAVLGLHTDYKKDLADGSKAAVGAVQDYFKKGGFPGRVSTIAKATPTVRGEFVQKGSSPALKAAGVKSVPEFMAKAASEGISGKAAVKAAVDNYGDLGLRHDLQRVSPADVALGNPDATIRDLHNLGDDARTATYVESMNAFDQLAGHVKAGLWADHADPEHAAQALLTNLAGHNRTGGSTDILYGAWLDSIEKIMTTHGISGEEITKAVTGDMEAFGKLVPEGQGIARQWRTFGNALMHEASGTKGAADNFVGNWLPFRFEKVDAQAATRGAGGRIGAFKTASQAHKTEALKVDQQGRLILTQQYQSPFEANADFGRMRSALVSELTNPETALREELQGSKWAKEIRALAATDPAAALTMAQRRAREYYPNFETDFSKIARQWNAASLKSLRTHQALQIFGESIAKDGRPLVMSRADIAEQHGVDTKDYLPLPGKMYENHLFHPDFHPKIERYVDQARKGLANAEGFKTLLDLEGKSVGAIMFSPPIHMMNMAARAGAAWVMNPIEMTSYLMRGKGLSPMQRDVESNALRKFAIEAGGIPPTRGGHTMLDNLSARGNDALATVDQELQKIERDNPNAIQRFSQSHRMLNDWIWNHYRDFGTMMTHLEYIAARKHGMSDTEAKLLAGRRGASWTGLANPENVNPAQHDFMRAVVLAPGYWMSFAQLMVPIYRRAGLSAKTAPYLAYQGAKFMAAAWTFQHLTGNLANFLMTSSSPGAMDGHFQNQNLPGNQDRIEATAPWLSGLPGFEQIAALDPKKGGRRTVENPLGRQMRDLEMAAGLESGQKDWRPGDVRDGLTKVAISRISPLLEGLGAAGNIDLYRTATTGGLAHIDPTQPVGLSPASPLYALLMMTPLGSQYAEQVAASMSDPHKFDPSKGPFGLTVPKAMADVAGNTKTAAERVLYTWATGTNPPYDYAAKSRGTPVTDAQFQKYEQARTTYQTEMAAASAKALGGQMTPYEYLNGTRDGKWPGSKKVSANYRAIASSTFHDAPSYINGAEGLLNQYEALYDKAADPAGGVDYAKLDQLQAKFKQDNAANPYYQQMQQILQQNSTKFPMEDLYHKTIAAYGKWQENYAQRNGVDINTLRQEISQYGSLYGDPTAGEAFLRAHQDLALYERAKKSNSADGWDYSNAGLMYGLFYGSSLVSNYMRARHLTEQAVEQGAEQAVASA